MIWTAHTIAAAVVSWPFQQKSRIVASMIFDFFLISVGYYTTLFAPRTDLEYCKGWVGIGFKYYLDVHLQNFSPSLQRICYKGEGGGPNQTNVQKSEELLLCY